MKGDVINIDKTLVSEKKSVKLIEPIIFGLKEKINLNDQSFYNMLIAVTEAVNNAIIHGNGCNPRKNVQISLQADDNEITIVIEDEGSGFDPEKLADPRAPENLMKEHGRGVFLMKELADSINISYTGKGSKIKLKFLNNA